MPKDVGHFRIGNKREGIGPKPRPGELVMDGDRLNLVLGNPIVLNDPDDIFQRVRVIEMYIAESEVDWTARGPRFDEIHRIANLVIAGSKIICMCWCTPKPCHLDWVAARVNCIVGQRTGHLIEPAAQRPPVLPPTDADGFLDR